MSKFHHLFAGKVTRILANTEETLITIEDRSASVTVPVDFTLGGDTFEALDRAMADGTYISLGVEVEDGD